MVETTDDGVIMDRKGEILPELLMSKADQGLDFLFLAVVNIVDMRSSLLVCDAPEVATRCQNPLPPSPARPLQHPLQHPAPRPVPRPTP